MMTHRLLFPTIPMMAILMLFLPAGTGRAETVPPMAPAVGMQPTTGTLALLEELEQRHGDRKTIQARFEQIRRDELFEEDIASSGSLWFQRDPDLFRIDYLDPDPMITLIRPDALYLYMEAFNQVQYWRFESPEEYQQQLHKLLLGFGFKVRDLVRRYEIHSSRDQDAARIELEEAGLDPERFEMLVFRPRPAFREESPFTLLKVVIDKSDWLPEKIWYRDTTESTMTIRMTDITMDIAIDPRHFDPANPAVLPPDATYINTRDVL